MELKIRPAIQTDYDLIAKLHIDGIATGFLSKLGRPFLSELYRAIQQEKGSTVLVAEADGHVEGFIAGTVTIHGLYKNVIIKNCYRFVIPLLRFILNPRTLRMIIETFLYGFKTKRTEEADYVHAELLSISVSESKRGSGVGKALLADLELYFRSCGISLYKVVTYSKDDRANRFYRSCRFYLNRQFIHHGNLMNEYMKKLV